jgi:hypothetical protein
MVQNVFRNKNIFKKKLKLRLKNTIIDNFNICIRNLDTNKERERKRERERKKANNYF